MPADPSRIAQFTVDGVLLSKVAPLIKTTYPGANEQREIEMFFDSAADGQVLLDERWAWQSKANRIREAVELDVGLGLGTAVPLTPALPQFTVIDESRDISTSAIVKAYAANFDTDRYAVELIGL